MTNEQILKVLKNERECIKRQDTVRCCRNLGYSCQKCDLCLEDKEILEVYDTLIEAYEVMTEPKPDTIRPITDDRRWRAELDIEKRTLSFYRDDENGAWTYDDVLKFGGWDE